MPEQLQLDVKADKDFIYVFDTTGAYKTKQNECGWGLPNLRTTDITKAEIIVSIPNIVDSIVIDVHPSFPNDSCVGFEITPQDLGIETITSGIWNFEYRAFHHPGTPEEELFVVSCRIFLYASIECCIDARKPNYDVVNPDSDSNKKTNELAALLDIAIWAACKGDFETAQEIADRLNLQCECSD